MTLILAWRNLLRNRRRTLIAGAAIGIGLAALIFSDALILGMERSMVSNVTDSFMGQGQIHAQGYRETPDVSRTIRRLPEVVARLHRDPRVSHFSVRTLSVGMISSPSDFRSILLVGAEPDSERYLSQVDAAVIRGDFFRGSNPRDLVIGSKLADELGAAIGDRVVVTVAQAKTGDLSQELFHVSGIYRLGVREMDRGMVFVRLDKAQAMLGLPGQAHEIAIRFNDSSIPTDPNNPFWSEYSRDGDEALGWPRLMPQVEASFNLLNISLYFIATVLFGVVAFGIINTLFMSIYERIFEFGVLRALGTRPRRLGGLIVTESALLAAISICFGIVLGTGISWVFSVVGIDYRGIEFEGVTLRHMIYPVISARQFVVYPLWVLGFTVFTGLYPAVYAARIRPAEAMRRSL